MRRHARSTGARHLGLSSFLLFFAARDFPSLSEQCIGGLHRHPAEVRDEVGAVGVTSDVAFSATASVLATERQHVATVATPVCANVVDGLETMRDAMIYLLRVVFLSTYMYEVNMHFLQSGSEWLPLTPVFDFDIHLVTTFW